MDETGAWVEDGPTEIPQSGLVQAALCRMPDHAESDLTATGAAKAIPSFQWTDSA